MTTPPRKSLGRLIAQTFGTTLVSQVSQFASGIVVAHALGPAGKGIIGLAALLAFFGATIADGLNNAISKQIGSSGYPAKRVWAAAMRIYAVAAPIGVLVFGTLYALHRDNPEFLAVAVAFPFVMFVQTSCALYVVGHRIDRFNTQNAVTQGLAVSIGTIVAASVFHAGVPVILIIFSSGWIATAAWAASGVPALLAVETSAPIAAPPIGAIARLQAIFAAKSSISSTVTYFALRIDTILTGVMLGPAELGIYALAQALGEMMWLVSRSIMWAAMGRIASDALDDAVALTTRVVRTLIGVQFVLALGAFVFAPPLITLVYGVRFHEAGDLMRILLPGMFIYSADGTLAYFISVRRGRPGLLLALETGSLALCAALTVALIPRYGMRGAAVAHTVAYVLAFSVKATYFARTSRVGLSELLLPRFADVPARFRAALARRTRGSGQIVNS